MAVKIVPFRGAFVPSDPCGYIVESKYVKGSYTVVQTLQERDSLLPTDSGLGKEMDVITEGSLVYVINDEIHLYMFKDGDWKPFSDIITSEIESSLSSKQDALISGQNIKTINGQDIIGSGNLTVGATQVNSIEDLSNISNPTEQHIVFVKLTNETYRYDSDMMTWRCVGRGDLSRDYYDKTQVEDLVNTSKSTIEGNIANTYYSRLDVDDLLTNKLNSDTDFITINGEPVVNNKSSFDLITRKEYGEQIDDIKGSISDFDGKLDSVNDRIDTEVQTLNATINNTKADIETQLENLGVSSIAFYHSIESLPTQGEPDKLYFVDLQIDDKLYYEGYVWQQDKTGTYGYIQVGASALDTATLQTYLDENVGKVHQFETRSDLLAFTGTSKDIAFVKENESTYRWNDGKDGKDACWKCVGKGDLTEYYTKQEVENKIIQMIDTKQDKLTNDSLIGTINGVELKYGESIQLPTVEHSVVVEALSTPEGQGAITEAIISEGGQSAIITALDNVTLDGGNEI